MELSAELASSIQELSSAGPVEVRENGKRVAPLSGLSWEVRGNSEKPLLHLWSEVHNMTRRVLAITGQSDNRLALAVERFGRTKPDRLEFVRTDFERNAREVSREEFCARLRNILAAQFPDDTLESLSVSADLEHSLSPNYVRGVLRKGSTLSVLLAVSSSESADTIENSLTFALLWLDYTRQRGHRGTVSGVRLIVPKGTGSSIADGMNCLNSRAGVELFELDAGSETLHRLDYKAAANLATHLVPRRETQALLDRAASVLGPVLALNSAIRTHPSVRTREILLRFRGVPFARYAESRMFFGVQDPKTELTRDSWPRFRALFRDLESHRHPLASDTRHPLYRAQAERWLESLVSEDLARIDAFLDPRYVYSQVFEDSGGEHGILDLLGVTLAGRLAIIELKANEHIHLPLQAASYFLRIRRHLESGDFAVNGYFPRVELQSAPPLVYLVAPALRFHPSTDALLGCLDPQMEVIRVGIVESWRRGLRVVMRK